MAIIPLSAPRLKRVVPLIVAVALLMENVDSSVLSTSLPAMAVDLATDPIHLKLVLTSYLLALAVFYGILSYTRLEVFKMLLSSFFPLLIMILAVLGSILAGIGFAINFPTMVTGVEITKWSELCTGTPAWRFPWIFKLGNIFSRIVISTCLQQR